MSEPEASKRMDVGRSLLGALGALRRRESRGEKLYLWHEEEQDRLGVVAKDAADSEGHAGKVTVSITDKNACGMPVETKKGKRDT
eukprot:scaffold23831_cov30-Tisochrysis_lutea.AAC.5